jgi:hypothetical protein
MSQGLVRICPQGFYRETYRTFDDALAQVCVACNPGITTAGAGSVSPLNCSVVLLGYGINNTGPATGPGGVTPTPLGPTPPGGLPAATVCAIGYYSSQTVGSCIACPSNTTTRSNGSKTIEECGEWQGCLLLLLLLLLLLAAVVVVAALPEECLVASAWWDAHPLSSTLPVVPVVPVPQRAVTRMHTHTATHQHTPRMRAHGAVTPARLPPACPAAQPSTPSQ